MNIFVREMKANRKSLIIWCIGVILMVAAGMTKYEVVSSSGQYMNDIISSMPKSLQVMFGIASFDLSKASGFYGVIFSYLVLMAAIHASMLGSNIISKEERDKTAEFLMVKPVSRNKVVTSKLLAAFLNIVIFNAITLISSITIVNYYAKNEKITHDIIILMIGMFILQLMFLTIGTGIAAINKNPKIAVTTSTAILLITFILSMIVDINSNLEGLKYIIPFKYYEAKNLMFGGGFDPIFLTISFIIIGVLLYITYVFYRKRDLNI
ncbi:MAG: ABC transporter permease subunit [Clostridium argentinense]|uniref:ABC transporter permease subunit n=1 Tax=Clostridium faecium TaxID=2762223 RepID=A0ABR8YTZ8_9CLOT|nr:MULTISPECIES: ABC transporter permease subunit [Clostridium]MBD8047763.1 ABC transporter permease subunit [Clostridium faecium]MBS5824159.1 ABC transporter permease subunit [Clostridium argentinense]MDU1350437.1 ABC transporter permease subunit [Clostridium argentinense]